MTDVELVPVEPSGHPARDLGPLPDAIRQNCGGTAAFYRVTGYSPPWIGYVTLLTGNAVGGGAFKGPPRDGRVEIAYYTLPAFEGCGIATATARELVRLARATAPGVLVTAQTLPETNASTTVLRKLGFAFQGVLLHPEDGEIWDWHLPAGEAATP